MVREVGPIAENVLEKYLGGLREARKEFRRASSSEGRHARPGRSSSATSTSCPRTQRAAAAGRRASTSCSTPSCWPSSARWAPNTRPPSSAPSANASRRRRVTRQADRAGAVDPRWRLAPALLDASGGCGALPLIAIVGPTAVGQERAGPAPGRGARRRDRLLRQPAGLPRPRHRQREADAGGAAPRPASPDRRASTPTSRSPPPTTRGWRRAALADIAARGRLPIVAGGTGLYLRALLHGLFEGPVARRGAARRGWSGSPSASATRGCIGCWRAWTRRPPRASQPRDRLRVVRALEVFRADRPAALRAPPRGRATPLARLRRAASSAWRPPRDALRAAVERRTDEMLAARPGRGDARRCSRGYRPDLRPLRRSATGRRSPWCAASTDGRRGAA